MSRQVRAFVYSQPTDMRLGFDGLYGRVRDELGANPLSGDIFLFIGKDRRKAKSILWDGTGLIRGNSKLTNTQQERFNLKQRLDALTQRLYGSSSER